MDEKTASSNKHSVQPLHSRYVGLLRSTGDVPPVDGKLPILSIKTNLIKALLYEPTGKKLLRTD
jgi:hypothetical protein